MEESKMYGYKRKQGLPGIRNYVTVIFTVDCSRVVAEKIAKPFEEVITFGFPGCGHNDSAYSTLYSLGTHPNVGAVLIVALGCEGTDFRKLKNQISKTGRYVDLLVIQERGEIATINKGQGIIVKMKKALKNSVKCPIEVKDLIIGIECGGSDSTSGLAANPAAGYMADRILGNGGTIIVEEFPELLGCKDLLKKRGLNKKAQFLIEERIEKSRLHSQKTGHYHIGVGNKEGGLSTIEDKSLGAACKLGKKHLIRNILVLNEVPTEPGLYLLDNIESPEDKWLCMCQRANDAFGNTSLSASHAQIIVFTTGRGNVIGAAVSPVIKVTGNTKTYNRMKENMDINAGEILIGSSSLEAMGMKIYEKVINVASGKMTKSEVLNHHESWITYHFNPEFSNRKVI
ncbi:MAG: UxaA family hydrolase [Eubacteriaceae bacterium]